MPLFGFYLNWNTAVKNSGVRKKFLERYYVYSARMLSITQK